MATKILKQIGEAIKHEAGELVKQTGQEVQKNLKEAGKEAAKSITGMEFKDSEQSPAQLEQLKKIGEQKELAKEGQLPELRAILKQQGLEKQAIEQAKQMKQQMVVQEARQATIEKTNKPKILTSLSDLGSKPMQGIFGMPKNKKENKSQ